MSVIDVGTGSGVLSIICAQMGCLSVTAIDIDEHALHEAEYNIAINNVREHVFLKHMSVGELDETADVVVANVPASFFIKYRKQLVKGVNKGGLLILSGILDEQEQAVRDALVATWKEPIGSGQEKEWRMLVYQKRE
jgi:ribosomal protein L11 methyltransferase